MSYESQSGSISPRLHASQARLLGNNSPYNDGPSTPSVQYIPVTRTPIPRSRKLKNTFKDPEVDCTKDLKSNIISILVSSFRRRRGLVFIFLFIFIVLQAFSTSYITHEQDTGTDSNSDNAIINNQKIRESGDDASEDSKSFPERDSSDDNDDKNENDNNDKSNNNNNESDDYAETDIQHDDSFKEVLKIDNTKQRDAIKGKDENEIDAINSFNNHEDKASLTVGVGRNGCPFGFVSLPGDESSRCYYLGLEPETHTKAEYNCKKLGAHLATVLTKQENDLLCTMMAIADNRHARLEMAHIGLKRDEPTKSNVHGPFTKWEDGTSYDAERTKGFWIPGEPDGRGYKLKDSTSKYLRGTFAMIHCRKGGKWVDWSSLKLPYFCSMDKPAKDKSVKSFLDKDGIYQSEVPPPPFWHPTPPLPSSKCSWKPINHGNILLSTLSRQYPWKTGRRKKGSKKRYYAVWQTKHYFGYQRYWVGYLEDEQTFYPVPVGDLWHGSFGSSSSSSSGEKHTGYFHSQAVLTKYRPQAIFSRLAIPSSVLVHLDEGALVNQIYTVDRSPLGDKQLLFIALSKYAKQHNCDLEEAGIFPLSFDMSDRKQCLEYIKHVSIANGADNSNEAEDAAALEKNLAFAEESAKLSMQEASEDGSDEESNAKDSEKSETIVTDDQSALADSGFTKTAWLVKGSAHGGLDVHVMRASKVVSRYGMDCSRARNETVQRYITNPLLLDDRKFDVRAFMLVASTKPLVVYVYNETYFRGAALKFSDPTSTKNMDRHVTNMHVQQKNINTRTDWENYIWNPARVSRYAEKAGIPSDFASRIMIPKIKTTLQFVISAIVESLTDRRAGQWKLYGVDFVIDKNMHPWLVDVNGFPGFGWTFQTPWALGYRKKMLKSMWDTVFDVQIGNGNSDPNLKVPRSGGFELIYHGKMPPEETFMKPAYTQKETRIDNSGQGDDDSDDGSDNNSNVNEKETGIDDRKLDSEAIGRGNPVSRKEDRNSDDDDSDDDENDDNGDGDGDDADDSI